MSYKPFIVDDPTPWMDQFIRTAGIMAKRCGGSSVEFIINNMLKGLGHPNNLILAACEEGRPEELVAWLLAVYVPDTYKPWVEVWALWIKPGLAREMRDLGGDILLDWAKYKGAVRIVSVLTRSPRVFLEMFHKLLGFEQTGIVIERSL